MNTSLKFTPNTDTNYHDITPDNSPLEELFFQAKKINKNHKWRHTTGDSEFVIVLLGGEFEVHIADEKWVTKGGRRDVFSGMAHTMYIPKNTYFTLTAIEDCDLAISWATCSIRYEPVLVTPEDCKIELRGGDNANRQINSLIPPGFPCDRMVCVEVYTPPGSWSSYPPHKHDQRILNKAGQLIEADLEEIYFYKIDKVNGFAYQHIYTDDRSIDQLIRLQNDDVTIVPEGYHPVVAGPGYTVYYLNFLVGSDQSLANSPDKNHEWLEDTWSTKDKRLPIVTSKMNHPS